MRLVIAGAFPDDISFIKGGVEASVYGLAKTLKQHPGIENIEVISLPLKAGMKFKRITSQVSEIKVTYLESKKFLVSGLIHLPFIISRVLAERKTILHVHGTGLLQLGLILLARLLRINCVWTLHGITAKETRQTYQKSKSLVNLARYIFYSAIENLSIICAQKIIVDTEYVINEIGRREKVFVIPQGIFKTEFEQKENKLRAHDMILSVGVINPRKGHHHLLEAFALVKAQIPFAKLVIVGASPIIEYYEWLKQLVCELDIADSVRFIINPPRQEVINLLNMASIFALHSEEESQGIALCEAMMAGLPVVATKVGGIPFVIKDQHDGLLVDYGDKAGFANALVRLLQYAELKEQFSLNARISGAKFDWQDLSEEIYKLYQTA